MATSPHKQLAQSLFDVLIGWRREVALVARTLGVWMVLGSVVVVVVRGRLGSDLAWLVPIAYLVSPRGRRRVRELRVVAPMERQIGRVFRAAEARPFVLFPPLVVSVTRTGSRTDVELRLRRGTAASELDRFGEHLAVAFGVRDVRFARYPNDAGAVRMTIIHAAPFHAKEAMWPLLGRHVWSFALPVPLGIDEDDNLVSCALPEHHLLIGGEPGSGKSNALSLVLGAAALDPMVELYLLDGKLVELSVWSKCATAFVGPDVGEATRVLGELREEMDRRYGELQRLELRKATPSAGFSYILVVCDELALYLNHPDKKAAQRFAEVLRDLVARGRAAGIVVVAATQKPSADVVPSSLRDLFGYRWAMRCATRDASDTILGAGWASLGYSAAEFEAGQRGVGFLRHEEANPVRLLAYHVDDASLLAVARRAEALRTIRAKEGA